MTRACSNIWMEVCFFTSLSSVTWVSLHQPHWVICADWMRWNEKCHHCAWPRGRAHMWALALASFRMSFGLLFPFSIIPALHPRRTYAGPDVHRKGVLLKALPLFPLNLAVPRLNISDRLRLLFDSNRKMAKWIALAKIPSELLYDVCNALRFFVCF